MKQYNLLMHELKLRYYQANGSKVPAQDVPRFSYRDKTANGLTRMIIDHIKFNGWQAERHAVTGRFIKGKTFTDIMGRTIQTPGKYIKTSGTVGSFDISATIAGISVKIEIKIGRDKMSEEQKAYQIAIERAGGVAIVMKDFQSWLEWYDGFMLSDRVQSFLKYRKGANHG